MSRRNGGHGALLGLMIASGVAPAQSDPTPIAPPTLPPPVVQDAPGPPLPEPSAPPATPLPAPPAKPTRRGDEGLGGSLRGTQEYLLWWMKSAPLPPLATRNPSGASPVLGDPDTQRLIGDSADLGERSGGRFVLTLPFNEARTVGLEGGYFFLGTRTETLLAAGTDRAEASVGRPYLDAATGRESAALIAAAGFMAGEFRAASSARAQGAEINLVSDLVGGSRWQLDGLVGYRFLQVHEGLGLWQQGLLTGPLSNMGPTAFGRFDQFDAHNRFHGGQVGLRGDVRKGPLFVELTGKVAFGVNNEVVKVGGQTAFGPVGGPATVRPGGLLALPSNSGRVRREAFAVVPEAIARVGWNTGERSRFFVGYNFLLLSDAVRPGDQIDRTVNVNQVPFQTRALPLVRGPERPLLAVNSSDLWLQGLILGFEGRW